MVWQESFCDPVSNSRYDKVPRIKHSLSLHHYFENDHCGFFLTSHTDPDNWEYLLSWVKAFFMTLDKTKTKKKSTKKFSEIQWLLFLTLNPLGYSWHACLLYLSLSKCISLLACFNYISREWMHWNIGCEAVLVFCFIINFEISYQPHMWLLRLISVGLTPTLKSSFFLTARDSSL